MGGKAKRGGNEGYVLLNCINVQKLVFVDFNEVFVIFAHLEFLCKIDQ